MIAVFDALTVRARAAQGDATGPADPAGGPWSASSATPPGEPGVDARRFDALVDALVGQASGVAATEAGPRADAGGGPAVRAAVNVTVALPTVLGLDDVPGELAGYGPIPAHLARQLARDGVLRRLVTDPVTGVLLGADSHTHPGGLSADPPDPPEPQVPPDAPDTANPADDPDPPDPPDHAAPRPRVPSTRRRRWLGAVSGSLAMLPRSVRRASHRAGLRPARLRTVAGHRNRARRVVEEAVRDAGRRQHEVDARRARAARGRVRRPDEAHPQLLHRSPDALTRLGGQPST